MRAHLLDDEDQDVQTSTTPSADASSSSVPSAAADEAAPRRARVRRTWVLPLVVGVVLGPLDLLLQHVLPYPFANLANSPATWALVAFAVGWFDRSRVRWRPAAAATVALLIAVEGYYLAAVVALGDDPATMTNTAALLWLALAVGAGAIFGTAGSWARSGRRWRAPVGTAAAVGVLLAEASFDVVRSAAAHDDPGYRQDLVQTALVLVVMAAVVAVAAGRSARQRLVGSLLAVAFAAAGALAFAVLFG